MAEPATTKSPTVADSTSSDAAAAGVEMDTIEKQQASGAPTASPAAVTQPADEKADETAAAGPTTTTPAAPTAVKGKEKEAAAAADQSKDSMSIDRPDDEETEAPTPGGESPAPVCQITLLLPTGARHPYKIDERYLAKRNVEIPDVTEAGKKDPYSISIYKLKELILREWREEWPGKPASPTSIRLIHFGKLLDDKEQIKKYQLSHESPNIIHMSVRPAEMMEEEEGAKAKSTGSGGRTREGGGCCVIL